jgi:hypothetical protein
LKVSAGATIDAMFARLMVGTSTSTCWVRSTNPFHRLVYVRRLSRKCDNHVLIAEKLLPVLLSSASCACPPSVLSRRLYVVKATMMQPI